MYEKVLLGDVYENILKKFFCCLKQTHIHSKDTVTGVSLSTSKPMLNCKACFKVRQFWFTEVHKYVNTTS